LAIHSRSEAASAAIWPPEFGRFSIAHEPHTGNYIEVFEVSGVLPDHKGDRHSQKENLRYAYEDTPENRSAIAEYERCAEEVHEAEKWERAADA
jgi:hypothetical protein